MIQYKKIVALPVHDWPFAIRNVLLHGSWKWLDIDYLSCFDWRLKYNEFVLEWNEKNLLYESRFFTLQLTHSKREHTRSTRNCGIRK